MPRPEPGDLPDQSPKLWTNPIAQANFTQPNCCRFRPFRAAVFDHDSHKGMSPSRFRVCPERDFGRLCRNKQSPKEGSDGSRGLATKATLRQKGVLRRKG